MFINFRNELSHIVWFLHVFVQIKIQVFLYIGISIVSPLLPFFGGPCPSILLDKNLHKNVETVKSVFRFFFLYFITLNRF